MKLGIRVESPCAEPFVYECREPSVTIGRSPRCEIRIPTEHYATRHHARIFLRDESWYIEDLRTRNKFLLNGSPTAYDGPSRLREGYTGEEGEQKDDNRDPFRRPRRGQVGQLDPDLLDPATPVAPLLVDHSLRPRVRRDGVPRVSVRHRVDSVTAERWPVKKIKRVRLFWNRGNCSFSH